MVSLIFVNRWHLFN